MGKSRCDRGHWFDDAKFESCPVCMKESQAPAQSEKKDAEEKPAKKRFSIFKGRDDKKADVVSYDADMPASRGKTVGLNRMEADGAAEAPAANRERQSA